MNGRKMQLAKPFLPVLAPAAVGLALTALAFLLPLALPRGAAAVLPPSPAPVEEPEKDGEEAAAGADASMVLTVAMGDGSLEEMTLGQYLYGVVAAEMPASFEEQALRAQTVAARTYTLWKAEHSSQAHPEADVCTDFACCQAYTDPEAAAESWGDQAQTYEAKLRQAVADTDGMVLTWQGQLIQAVFHSSSAGSTRDAVEVWGASVPYLVAVDSPEGEEVPNYRTTVTFTPEELSQALAGQGADLTGDPAGWLGEAALESSGSVATLEVGGAAIEGNTLRTLLGLRSAHFTAAWDGEAFVFSVTGYGHGVGMSQYGANAMAKEGSTWQEILTHYYTGVEIVEKR